MSDIEARVLEKLIGMFRPHKGRFLTHAEEDTIDGPNDRSLIGFDTSFPIEWLIEDFGFTPDEARWLVDAVRAKPFN